MEEKNGRRGGGEEKRKEVRERENMLRCELNGGISEDDEEG